MELMTVGYEGLDLVRFFDLLRAGRVDTLIDVRQMPISRKKGFSKNALAAAACESGFHYVHLVEFGCPKPVRDDYRQDGDWARYTERYLEYLDTQDGALTALTQRVFASRCCLLCFEADANVCHRSLVAARVAQIAPEPLSVVHLGLTTPALAA